jgi:diketogulonate reductase-like aldo/keto reductase
MYHHQVSLKFLLQKDVAIVPWTASLEYQRDNLDLYGFNLTKAEMRTLNKLPILCRGKEENNCSTKYGILRVARKR